MKLDMIEPLLTLPSYLVDRLLRALDLLAEHSLFQGRKDSHSIIDFNVGGPSSTGRSHKYLDDMDYWTLHSTNSSTRH